MTPIFFIAALLCYVTISIYFMRSLLAAANHLANEKSSQPTKPYRIHRTVSISLLVVGMLCHALTLYPFMLSDTGNINFNLLNVISLTTLVMLGFSLLFSSYRPVIVLNVLAAPIAAMGLLVGYLNTQPANLTNLTELSLSMELHIVLSIVAYSVFFMAATQAILLHLQYRELKHHTQHRVWVKLLPPLETMESLLFDMILVGFCLLSVALALGFVGVTDLLAQHLAHKTVFSLLAWLLFAWLLYDKHKHGWRGKRAANITLWGFGLLAIGFIGTKFVLEWVLGR